MSRYIDADLLKQSVQGNITRYYTCGAGGYCLAEDVIEDIDSFPTADAVEVRHGEWGFDGLGWTCSECGEYALYGKSKMQIGSNYCPNCGAKMDGERSENGT